ncbi:MAG: MotA/TolQ/ExbB proton channel family protein [Puniceicoccales bacterium]|jgi:biopolymer transport protein ExbB|nr:MotA/TolQ/ExbB proton channel family protein [Puniceicoccales bacterium]
MPFFSLKFLSLGYGLMGLLFVLAAAGIILTIERLLFFKCYDMDPAIFLDGIRNLHTNDKISEAIDLCERDNSPVANIMRTALLDRNLPSTELKAHVKSVALLEIPRCEQRVLPLRTIAKITPMLGLIGVVLAFFDAFKSLQESGLSYTSSNIFSKEITSAMLLITVSLAISIFANLAYNFLYGKVQSMIYGLEWTYNEALQIIFSKK